MNPTTGMSGLVGELSHIPLGDDSPKWYYFGLVPPVGSDSPGAPDSVSIHQVSDNCAAVGGAAYPSAANYRHVIQVEVVDANFVALDLTNETQVLLESLPAKAIVHFEVTATMPPAVVARARRQA